MTSFTNHCPTCDGIDSHHINCPDAPRNEEPTVCCRCNFCGDLTLMPKSYVDDGKLLFIVVLCEPCAYAADVAEQAEHGAGWYC
jgi:hypothetical protein